MPECELDFGSMYFKARGEGPDTVVLLHDYFGTHRGWNAQQLQLSRYFLVLAPDLRGHGRSTLKHGRLSITDMAEDIAAMFDQIGVGRAHVVGCSHGAVVAMHMARCFRERVASIVVTSVPDLDDQEVIEYGRQYAESVFPRLEPEMELVHGAGQTGYTRDVLLKSFIESLDAPPVDHLNALRLADRIECPVLILGGDSDPVMSPERALKLMRKIPTCNVGILPGAGHLAHHDSPASYSEAVVDHVWRCKARRGSSNP